MLDEKKWTLASAQFQALRKNLPGSIGESLVAEYHGMVSLFEVATGDDLSSFRISPVEVKPRVTSVQIGSRRHAGGATYSQNKYCNSVYFKRQLEGLATYLSSLQTTGPKTTTSRDYDALTNEQLEQIAREHNIDSYGDAFGGISRGVIINALRERDRALQPQQPMHSLHIGQVTRSIIQQSPSHSPATLHFHNGEVDNVVTRIKAALPELTLSAPKRSELDNDVQTIELQLSSPNPKNRVIAECLHSARAILEGITGSLIASGIAQAITQIVGR